MKRETLRLDPFSQSLPSLSHISQCKPINIEKTLVNMKKNTNIKKKITHLGSKRRVLHRLDLFSSSLPALSCILQKITYMYCKTVVSMEKTRRKKNKLTQGPNDVFSLYNSGGLVGVVLLALNISNNQFSKKKKEKKCTWGLLRLEPHFFCPPTSVSPSPFLLCPFLRCGVLLLWLLLLLLWCGCWWWWCVVVVE